MNKKTKSLPYFILTLLSLFVFTSAGASVAAGQQPLATESMPGQLAYIRFDPDAAPRPFTPTPQFLQRAQVQTADIQVNYIGSWTAPAINAFEYAVSIWESYIVSPVPITVDAEFKNLGPNILGGAGPANFFLNVTNEPIPNTWYPAAIANALVGFDIKPGEPEIDSVFSSTFNWYYGIDGQTPNNQIDFVSVVLHEIGHGLGFAGSMRVSGGIGSWGSNTPYPFIYDRYTENGAGTSLINGFPNNSSALAAQLQSNNLFFDGPNANAANGGRVPLYAPTTWQQGSSYSHLAESFNNTPNSLMTYSLGAGQAEHDPGPVALGILADMGWQFEAPPVVSTLPNVLLLVNSSADNAIDLWAYTSDDKDADNQLVFAITNQTNASAGVSLDGNRYIDVNPAAGWTGSSTVTVKVTDTDNLAATATFKVVVADELFDAYLPLVLK